MKLKKSSSAPSGSLNPTQPQRLRRHVRLLRRCASTTSLRNAWSYLQIRPSSRFG